MLRFHLLFPCRFSPQISAHLQIYFFLITVCERTFTSLVNISIHQLYFSTDLGDSVPGLGAVSHGILLQETAAEGRMVCGYINVCTSGDG